MSETNVYRIWIKATPERIWRALTDPQELEGYGYGGRFEVDIRAAASTASARPTRCSRPERRS